MAAHSFSSPPGLTVTRARRKRTGTLAGNTGLQRRAGVARNAGPSSATGFRYPERSAWHTGTRFRNQSTISRLVFR